MKKTSVRKNGHMFGKMNILEYFFEEPEREFHLREIARLAGISPSTASNYLSEFAKKGVITSKNEKGFSIFKSNPEDKLYKDMKLFYNLYRIRASGLIDYLATEFNHPKAIILFGSFRKSENIKSSDTDLFIETSVKRNPNLSGFERRLGHPVHLFQFSSKEVEGMKEKNKELLNSIINGILLEGFFEVFR